MATVREIRARFTGEASALTKIFKDIRTEASKLGPAIQSSTATANRHYETLGKSANKLGRALQEAGEVDAFKDLSKSTEKAKREFEATGKVSTATMAELNTAIRGSTTYLDSLGAEGRASFGEIETAIAEVNRDFRTLGVDTGLDNLQGDINGAQNNLNNLGDTANSADSTIADLGNSSGLGGLDGDINGAQNNLNNLSDTANSADSTIQDLGNDSGLDNLNSDTNQAGDNLNDLTGDINDVDNALDNADEGFDEFGDSAVGESDRAEGAFGKLGGVAKTLAGTLVAAFAVDKIKDFFLSVVETTADLGAINSQYEQVMGGMKETTDVYLNDMAETWNKHPNQLKSAYMQYVALLKGKGVDEKEAHETAQKYMDLTVDGNAFANEAMEDTVARFAGMIKGEYSSVDTAMVNLTATQLDMIAETEYGGKKFAELNTAEQELLKTNEALRQQDIAGVIGQGAREADSYQNNVAMLSETWKAFIAEYGGPAMNFANERLKQGIEFVQGLGDRIEGARKKAEPFIKFFGTLKEALDGLLTDDGQKGRDILKGLGFSEEMIMRLDGYAASFAGFRGKIIDFVDGIKGLFVDDGSAGRDLLASVGLSPDLIAKLDEWAYNFSIFRTDMQEAWFGIKRIFEGNSQSGRSILENMGFSEDFISKTIDIIERIKSVGNTIKDVFIFAMPLVKSAVSAVVSFLVEHFSKIFAFWQANGPQFLEAVGNIFKGIMAVIKFVMPAVLAIIKMVWGNIKGVISGALDVIMGIVKVFSGLFTGDFAKMWEGLKQMFFGAVEFIWNFIQLTFYGKILGGAKAFILAFRSGFVSLWNAVKSIFTGNGQAIVAFLKRAWDEMWGATKLVFTNISGFLRNTWNSIRSIATGFINGIKIVFTQGWSFIRNTTTSVFNGIWNFLRTIWTTITSFIRNTLTGFVNFLRTSWNTVYNTTRTIFTNVWTFFRNIFTNIRTFLNTSVGEILTRIRNTWNTVYTTTSRVFRDIFNAIKGRFTDIVNAAKALPGRIGTGIGNMASKVTSGVTKVINTLARTLGKGVNGVIGGINWVLGKIGVDTDIPKWTVPQWAQGTPSQGHPGGLAIVNDGKGANAGQELIQTPDGKMGMVEGNDVMVNLPKGSQVLSAKRTKEFLKSIPGYALGTDIWDGIKGFGSRAWDGTKALGSKIKDVAFDVFDYIKNPSGLLDLALKTLGISRPSESGLIGSMAKGAFDSVKDKAIDFVKDKIKLFGDSVGSGSFGAPFRRSSGYGRRSSPGGIGSTDHRGIDYAAPAGTPIPSQTSGQVIQAGYHNLRGNYVRVRSGAYEYLYQHNTRNLVGVGDTVRKGQIIGTVGSTGASTGAHLHYETFKNGVNVNPDRLAGYADGAYKLDRAQLAWIAEGGWAESVISYDPSKRASQESIWRKTGTDLGFENSNGEPSKAILQILERIAQGVESDSDRQIIMSDRVVGRLVEKYVTENQDRRKERNKKFGGE